jgi:formylglycine-generating enzyme required for sulfatase activity
VWYRRLPVLAVVGGAVLALGLGVWLLAGIIFKVQTKDGILVIEVNEPNPTVSVDGDLVAVTWDNAGKKAEIRVRPGTHQVEVKKEGFTVHGAKVTLAEGGREVLTARLEKIPPLRPAPLDCTGASGVSAEAVRRAQAAWAKYLGRQVEEEDEIAPGVKMVFVLVPPGHFRMGSPVWEKDRFDNETQHEVELTQPFYLGKFEVTQAQYKAVTGQNPSHFKGVTLPVEQVSWEEASAFAKELSGNRGLKHLYRLPTEAEWEYACRGGRPSSQPFGIGDGRSLSSTQANFNGDLPYGGAAQGPHLAKTTPVGQYAANALGLYDMHGNIWEWCADWFGDYPSGKVTDPSGPSGGTARVARGGGWYFHAGVCRAAHRGSRAPGGRSDRLGFRLARVPSGLGK